MVHNAVFKQVKNNSTRWTAAFAIHKVHVLLDDNNNTIRKIDLST